MKKILVVVAAVATFAVAMEGAVFAADVTGPVVPVNAAVTEKCVITSNGSMDITIDPATAADLTFAVDGVVVQPNVKCTKSNTTVQVTASSGAATSTTGSLSSTLKNASLTPIPYTFTFTSPVTGNGFGINSAVSFGIEGTILQAEANKAEFGTYTDTVTLTLNY
jgi:hypothetical protein